MVKIFNKSTYENSKVDILVILLGLDEESSLRFSGIVNNDKSRAEFVRNSVQFLNDIDFDGLDIHWEYPGE